MRPKLQKPFEPFTIEVSAGELPKHILDRFAEPPEAKARLAVTIEPAESEARKLAALKRDLQVGLDDLLAGRGSEGEAVFARFRARFRGS